MLAVRGECKTAEKDEDPDGDYLVHTTFFLHTIPDFNILY